MDTLLWLLGSLAALAAAWWYIGIPILFAICIARYARWNSNLTPNDAESNMWDESGD